MAITREWLQEKIKEAKAAEQRALADANAYHGMAFAFETALQELEKPEQPALPLSEIKLAE